MSNNEYMLTLSFANATPDEGTRYARDLKDFLTDLDPRVRAEQQSERPDAQDLGATVVLVLGTTAVSALARGIATWLQRNSGARITIKNSQGELVAEGMDSKDVARIVQALSGTT